MNRRTAPVVGLIVALGCNVEEASTISNEEAARPRLTVSDAHVNASADEHCSNDPIGGADRPYVARELADRFKLKRLTVVEVATIADGDILKKGLGQIAGTDKRPVLLFESSPPFAYLLSDNIHWITYCPFRVDGRVELRIVFESRDSL